MTARRPQPWLEHAWLDLAGARDLLASPRDHTELVAYHIQQAAEKVVKTALVLRGVDVFRTHDISALAQRLPEDDALRPALMRLGDLSIYATAFRYPESGDPVSRPSRHELAIWITDIESLASELSALIAVLPKPEDGALDG